MKTQTIFDSKCNFELIIFIGENAEENWSIIDKASQYDYWFHLMGKPSCHVILKLPSCKSTINKQSLIQCAILCKENSKFAEYKNIKVMYTRIKNVKKGDVIGSVHTSNDEVIIV